MTREEFITKLKEIGFKDMQELNPDAEYPLPTFGWGIKHSPVFDLYGAEFYVRVHSENALVWRMAVRVPTNVLMDAMFDGGFKEVLTKLEVLCIVQQQ